MEMSVGGPEYVLGSKVGTEPPLGIVEDQRSGYTFGLWLGLILQETS